MTKPLKPTQSEITTFYKRPAPETVYVDLEPYEPKGVGSCCICNSNTSFCLPEQAFGSFVSSAAARTISYWFT